MGARVYKLRLRLDEEFNATILPNTVEVICPRATHVAVLDQEKAVKALGIVQQSCRCHGTVTGALGNETRRLHSVDHLPDVRIPVRGQMRTRAAPMDDVLQKHGHVLTFLC